jgi:hypothetical protein
MMKSLYMSVLVIGVVLAVQSAQADVIIIDEDFASFANSETYSGGVVVAWSDSDSSNGFERYNPPSGARGTDGTYDHDNNPLTPDVTLVGAVEVNDDAGNVTLTGSFALPGSVDQDYRLFLDFGADARANAKSATVEIFNVTDSRQVLPVSSVVYGAGSNPDWLRNDFVANLRASDVGDNFQIRFHEPSGSGGAGLQLTNLNLSAVLIPEPSSLPLLASGLLSLGFVGWRRRRRA